MAAASLAQICFILHGNDVSNDHNADSAIIRSVFNVVNRLERATSIKISQETFRFGSKRWHKFKADLVRSPASHFCIPSDAMPGSFGLTLTKKEPTEGARYQGRVRPFLVKRFYLKYIIICCMIAETTSVSGLYLVGSLVPWLLSGDLPVNKQRVFGSRIFTPILE